MMMDSDTVRPCAVEKNDRFLRRAYRCTCQAYKIVGPCVQHWNRRWGKLLVGGCCLWRGPTPCPPTARLMRPGATGCAASGLRCEDGRDQQHPNGRRPTPVAFILIWGLRADWAVPVLKSAPNVLQSRETCLNCALAGAVSPYSASHSWLGQRKVWGARLLSFILWRFIHAS